MEQPEQVDVLSLPTRNIGEAEGRGLEPVSGGEDLSQTIYKNVSKSFRIKSIEIVDTEYLYDDINLGVAVDDDDDVFLDKDKELNYVADHFAMDGEEEVEDEGGRGEHVYDDILHHDTKVQALHTLYTGANKTDHTNTRPRRISDVIDCLGDECVNLRRGSESGGITIVSPRSRASSDLGYSGSFTSSPAGNAFSFPPPSYGKRINDVTDSKPFNVAEHGDYVVPEAKMPVERDAEEYNMFHPRRGRAIIINNDIFDNNLGAQRKGSHVDVAKLEAAFTDLGCCVTIYDNMTFQEIKKVIHEISQEDHSDADCLMMAVLTHGMDGFLYARDSLYPVEALWNPFTADNCLTLAGKPKIFFIQACRGERLDPGVTLVSRKGSVSETDTGTAAYKIPSFSDFLLSYSSMQGFYSWRNPEDGTWFIQSLVTELNKNAADMNFLTLMTRVSRRVAVQYASNSEDVPWLHNQKQVPMFHSSLIRNLVFRTKPTTCHHVDLEPLV